MPDMQIDWERQYRNLETQMETMLMAIAKRMDLLEQTASDSGQIHQVVVVANNMQITCINVARMENPEFAWYVHPPSGNTIKIPYSRRNVLEFEAERAGNYRITAYVREAGHPANMLVSNAGTVTVSDSKE